MKILLYAIVFIVPLVLTAQNPTENYVKRTVYTAPFTQGITENDTLVSVTYFDGLGRPKQQVNVRAGGQGQDIVTPIVYDAFGRQTREYLPYTAPTQNGNIHLDPLAAIEAHYNIPKYGNTTNPYSEKILEASPLGRVMEQGAPGTPWMANPTSDTDHTIKFEYGSNTTDEVRLYRVATTANSYAPALSTYNAVLEEDGVYLPGRLYKTITKDENWQPGDEELHTTEEFKDFQGRVVLKRTYNAPPLGEPQGAVAHDTYYVYDDYGNLSFVIPPKVDNSDGVSPEELDQICYQYVYDHRNRLVEKKLPGKGWEYIVYNKGNRPVFTQDQKLLTEGKWLFTKYDKFGRVLYTGFFASGLSREALQTTLEGHTPIYDSKTNTPTLIEGKQVYYTNDAFPNTNLELLSINYYDTYTFDLDGAIEEESHGVTPTTKTKTLTTGTKVRVLGTNHWITTVSWYDEKARPIYSYTHNPYLNTIDKVKHKVNFIGNILETTTEHTKDGQAPITAIEKFTYDRMGRLLTHTHQITGQGEETLAENSYDALGQLIQKNVGNTPVAPLQTIAYSYNIRGWLTGINDMSNLGNNLFSFDIRYDDPSPGGTPLYNGNISQTGWRTNNTDSSLKNYSYAYDPLNRITAAIDNTGHYNLDTISYDKNGNILSLNRQGHINEATDTFGVMDELTYSYDLGNKLLTVEDTADDTFGFKDDAINSPDTTPDYTYDTNGNMISDTNKNITGITYNHLNLPTEITFNDDPNQKINYFYSADGIKQQKEVNDNGAITTTAYTGGYTYENSSLKFISQAEGYIEPDGAGGYDYVYQYKDHLGNVRLSYKDADNNGVIHGASTQLFFDDFEAASGWDGSGAGWGQSITSFDDTVTFDGDYSGRVYAAMGTSVAVHSNEWVTIDNDSDTDYIYTAWAYSESPIIRLGLGMKEDGEAGYLTLFDDILIIDELNTWVYVEKRVTVPAHITSLNVRIECAAWENRVGNVWFDNVSIRRVNDPLDVEIVEEKNYYPFGLKHKGYNNVVNGTENNLFTYNGVELEESLNLNIYEMNFRQYDPAIGRFTGIDPIIHYSMSPYVAFDNNPIYWADPSGADAEMPEWLRDIWNNSSSGFTQYTNTGNGTFEQTAHASDKDIKNGKAILIAFPDQNPDIPSNQGAAKKLEEWFGNGDGKVNGAGHAGIVIIDGEFGTSRYFDFGRYNRPDVKDSRGKDEGAVRSSANYRGLSIPNWDFEKSNEYNVNRIVTALHKSSIFKGYGTIMASLAEGLDYKAMFKYAQEMESKGYHAFGGYASSTNPNNATYCAKFARGVAKAGGFNWSWYVLTGKANVEDVNRTNKNGIKTIKD